MALQRRVVFRTAHAAGLLRWRIKDRKTHFLTDCVVAPHQFLDLFLRHVQLFAGFKVDGVDDTVGMDMLSVYMGADQHLAAVKVFCQPPRGFVSLPGIDRRALRKALHHVIEHHAAVLVVKQLGVQEIIVDVWNDKIFYQEKEFSAGFMAMSILNIPEEKLSELIQAGGAPTFLFPVVVQGSDEEAAAVFPQLRERILYLTELLWKYPPFCYNDYEKEMRRINILFDERNLLQIRTPDSEFQTEFLRFCVGIIRIPIAMYHFYAAGRFFELDYLRRLKKRNETHFAVAAHDCFNSEQFWNEMRSLQSLDMEPFTVYPELSSTYVFARSPKNEKEMVFVERVIFPRLTDFYTYDLMNGLHHGHAPSQCQGCGKYFLTTNGHIPKYCDGVAPQDNRYTCRQYGAMMHQKEQNKQHPVYRLFNTRTGTIRKHHQRGKISDDLRREALYLAESYRDKALMDNDYAADGYARDMELEHIYAEAEKRLK